MGCSSSQTLDSHLLTFNGIKRIPIKHLKFAFNKINIKFESLFFDSAIKQEISSLTAQPDFELFFDKIYLQWKIKLDKLSLTKDNIREIILQNSTNELIKEQFQKIDCNVYDWILTIIENFDFIKEEKIDEIKTLIYSSNNFYPNPQRALTIFYPENEIIKKYGMKPLLNNIKFKEDYKTQVMVIWISHYFLDSFETIADLCEIIELNEGLTTVCVFLQISDEKLLDEKYIILIKSIKYIFNTIKKRRNIISVFFGNMGDKFISLPREVIMSFKDLIIYDQLVFFGITKIILQKEFIDDIFKILCWLKFLKYCLLDLDCDGGYLEKFISSMCKNKNIIGSILGTIKIPEELVEEIEKSIKKANENFKVFHYEKNFKFSY